MMAFPPTKEELKQARQRLEFIAYKHNVQPRGYSVMEIVGMLKQRKYRITSEDKDMLRKACELNGIDYDKIRIFKPKRGKRK